MKRQTPIPGGHCNHLYKALKVCTNVHGTCLKTKEKGAPAGTPFSSERVERLLGISYHITERTDVYTILHRSGFPF